MTRLRGSENRRSNCVIENDLAALHATIASARDRLRRAVALRLDPRLGGRIDASDVVQEAMLEATNRVAEYERTPEMPPFLWLRLITLQRLALVHRQNLGVKARDVRREQRRGAADPVSASTASLASLLVGRNTSPSQAASREELRQRVQHSLGEMDPTDREVLVLRHFEQLTNQETAQLLDLEESAASKRYVRALKRMKELLTDDGQASNES